ncbi:protein FAR1-RELATED SEQUENCE 5-like [Arachis stenosperma]|uniref:protein FAR1-RELATED SEQUENCE 5-like n=1 Tax=Arachis stenosperma TaxID=217475 RepID=UPI0025AC4E1F|nr:protein FAR1-RELATED SEQUENCE 5-like [Arachis stenosperma]
MDTPIFEEALYGNAYDVRENSNSTDINVSSLSEDDTPHVEQEKESEDAFQEKDDATVSNNEVSDHIGIPMAEIPYVGLRFDSLQWAQEFYSNYTKKVGREGYRESRVKAAMRVKRITTAGCKARMYVMLDRNNNNWLVTKLELKHTHACSAEQAMHYSEYRKLTMHAKCVIQNNDEAGIQSNKTYLTLANEVGGSSKLGYSEKDVRNFITRNLRCADVNEDVKEMIRYFMRMRDINPNFFYAVDMDENNKFKSAIWVDARCRASYEYFGDVVSFDTTYRRNKHGLPFASFVGVNHHGKSTLLGCVLLGNEKIPSFEWVFKNWLNCMGNPPQAIITDQYKSIFGAIKIVFPNTRQRWCIWHIMKKIPHKLGGYAKYREIDDKMHGTVWNACSEESFEKDWYAWKTFKKIVECGFQYISKFVHEYDNVLGNKEQKELEDDAADSKGVVPCSSSSTIKRQFQREYTTSKFREVQHQFSKRGDCLVRGVTQEGDLFRVTVNEQYLLYGEPRSWKYSVELDPKTHKIWCECNMFGSRAQDFVTCEEEAAMLHLGLDQLRSKLLDCCANLVSRRVPSSQNSTVTQEDPHLGESDIQGLSKVSTKGRPRMKRLGSELNASIKNSMRRKKKNPPLDVDQALNQDVVG